MYVAIGICSKENQIQGIFCVIFLIPIIMSRYYDVGIKRSRKIVSIQIGSNMEATESKSRLYTPIY